jgi:choline-sulfatase
VIYLDIDSLRPDHLGCYGYHRDTSPNIDRIARQGVILRNIYASDVPCLPSRTAFFGGKFGTQTGVVNHGGWCADLHPEGLPRSFRTRHAENSFASRLTKAGYWTVSISAFPRRHSAYQAMWGFNEFYDTGRGGMENADEMFAPAADWLRRRGTEDQWFLHLNLWDPHTPYDTPKEFGNPFADAPIGSWLTEEMIAKQRTSFGPHSATEVPGYTSLLDDSYTWGAGEIRNLADAKAHIDAYDTGIAYADHYIGALCNVLDELGILDETAIIISADHGENNGELNIWGDHQTADEFTCHIPSIIKWPGLPAGISRDGMGYHLDLAETILDLAGARKPEGYPGRSLRGQIEGVENGRDALFLSQGAWSLQRTMVWDQKMLIHTHHNGMKDFPEWMLFDLANDRHLTTNLVRTQPEVVAWGAEQLAAHFRTLTSECPVGDPFLVIDGEGGPLHANIHSQDWADYLVRLRETGRGHHADWLTQNGGAPRDPDLSIWG